MKHILTVTPIILLAVAAGFYTGIQSNSVQDSKTGYNKGITHFFINGHKITFLPEDHPEIQGRHGFVYDSEDDEMFIQKGLPLGYTRTVCNHELIHLLGIPSENHDFINRNDEDVNSDLCQKLTYKLKEVDGITEPR